MIDMSKQTAVLNILKTCNIYTRLGSENISIPCPLAPYSPLHKSNVDSRPSMGIKVTDTAVLVNCFTCGFKSGQLSYLFSRLNYHDQRWSLALESVRQLEANYFSQGMSALRSTGYLKQSKPSDKPVDESLYTPYRRKLAPYLVARGITLDTARRWDVGVDLQQKRALIPVRDTRGSLWGAVGRSYANEKPKYMNYWEMKKGQHLLGAQLVKPACATIIVEGSIDAMVTDQALVALGASDDFNVISVLGSTVSQTQAEKIISISSEVIIALDADEAGLRGAEGAKSLLGRRIITRVADIAQTGHKDFGDCNQHQILEVIQSARLV